MASPCKLWCCSERFTIEVQLLDKQDFARRSLYYWAKTYVAQLGTGSQYSELNPTIGINFPGFPIVPGEGSRDLSDQMTIHFLDASALFR